jgi:hypothetical protein
MAIGARLAAPYTEKFDPSYRFATSWILSPALLFCFRALLSIYAFATLFTIFGWNGTHGMAEQSRHSFSYFTNLTYWGLAFYHAFAAIHTASYWLTGTPFLARWPKALQIAHSMFYSTVVIYPFIVTSKLLQCGEPDLIPQWNDLCLNVIIFSLSHTSINVRLLSLVEHSKFLLGL